MENKVLYKEIGKYKDSEDLVLGNLRLVVFLAKKYQGMGLSLDDLINEGTIGLCIARDKYDITKGKFSVYAAYWIKATIRQALNNVSRTIRVPAYLTHLSEASPKISTLDTSYQGSYIPTIETQHDDSFNKHVLNHLLDRLKDKQRTIIEMKYGIGYSKEMKTSEIAKKLGMTVQAVNGNIRNALKIMKD